MSRGKSNAHLFASPAPTAEQPDAWRSLCGETIFTTSRYWKADSINSPNCCRKCNAAFYATHLSGDWVLGPSMTQADREALGRKWDYRYSYAILDREGRTWGWVVMPGGFGAQWRLVRWDAGVGFEGNDAPKPAMGHELDDGSGRHRDHLEFKSKEAALAAWPGLVEAKGLLHRDATVEAAVARRIRYRANGERMAQEAAAKAQELSDVAQALREIQAQVGADLTNFQNEALARAALIVSNSKADA